MRLVVFGTHQYQWHMPLFALMHEKYWPGQKITYFCDRQVIDLPPSIEFRRVAGIEGDWDWEVNFIRGVRESLRTLDDKVVMITLGDMWPIRPVYTDLLLSLERYLATTSKIVIRMSAGQEVSHSWQNMLANCPQTQDIQTLEEWEGLEIRSCSPLNIHIGLCGGFLLWPSLWNRELLVNTIMGETWHHFEPDNTANLVGTDIRSTWVLPSSMQGKWWPPPQWPEEWVKQSFGPYIYRYSHLTARSNRKGLMLESCFTDEDKALIKAHAPPGTEFIE